MVGNDGLELRDGVIAVSDFPGLSFIHNKADLMTWMFNRVLIESCPAVGF